jgi:beta-galactosidase
VLTIDGQPAWGGIFFQAYQPTTGTASGQYDDGQTASVDNRYGKGRTRLIGTMTGYGHGLHDNGPLPAHSTHFFASLLEWANQAQHVRSNAAHIKARLHSGAGGTYLWVANPTHQPLPVQLELGQQWGPFQKAATLWGASASCDGRTLALTAPARDVTVLELVE